MNYERGICKFEELDWNISELEDSFLKHYMNKKVTIVRYDYLKEICQALVKYSGFVNIDYVPEINENTYNFCDWSGIEQFYFSESLLSQLSMTEVVVTDYDGQDKMTEIKRPNKANLWIPAYFIQEFWEIFENLYENNQNNESEDEENMNEMETEMGYDYENTSNTKEICRTIATDLLQNYESYESILNSLNEISEDDETDVTILATLFERLFK